MFYQHSNGSTTLPRGFRFHYDDEPRTPEPQDTNEPQMPSPPRQRLRVRRRNASTFNAPTEQFLASVAAEDIPIPTIEEPHAAPQAEQDSDMPDRDWEPLTIQTRFLSPQPFRASSPPKTPMPQIPIDDGFSQHHPDWSVGAGSSPAGDRDYFPRAMSSFSTPGSEFSDDSFYSGSRVSRPSDDGSCTSPESEIDEDPFQFSGPKGKGRALFGGLDEDTPMLNSKLHRKTRKDAPWSEAQSSHLWSTYILYLSDPTVTPFRIGHSAVPPQGIVRRVAREAKRSWKGPVRKPQPARLDLSRAASDKSGSLTPTAESRIYGQWPHSSNLTRSRLRELCRNKDSDSESNPVQVHRHFQSRSPTPFTKAFRKSEPPPTFSFNTSDIALSLTTSTAESMQPDGPLAQLASDDLDTPTPTSTAPVDDFKPLNFGPAVPKLGSPFLARTYGPSSSNKIRPVSPRTRSDTIVEHPPPRLGSPVRFDYPRSLNGTMKRRAQNSLDLDDQPASNPFQDHRRRVRSRGFTMGDEGLNRVPGVFRSQTQVPAIPTIPASLQSIVANASLATPPQLLPAAELPPPRLGSPFSASGGRNTFPRRLFQDSSATIRRSAFKTMHQTRRSFESFDFGEGPSLQSRLSHLDQRLKEIKERTPHEQRE